MPTTPNLSGLMPGLDVLQGLMKNAGSALPGFGQWLTPTLDPQELGKRIEELKTVQFWLEQNARMIATTVQALEVQRMTLTTLKTLNVQVGDLAEAFRIRPAQDPAVAPGPAPAQAPAPTPAAAARDNVKDGAKGSAKGSAAPSTDPQAPGLVDPMLWWGALTQQFTTLASQSLADRSMGEAATQMADAMMKGSAEVIDKALQPLAAAVAATPAAAPRPAKPAPTRATKAGAAGRTSAAGAAAKKPGARTAAKPAAAARKRAASR